MPLVTSLKPVHCAYKVVEEAVKLISPSVPSLTVPTVGAVISMVIPSPVITAETLPALSVAFTEA